MQHPFYKTADGQSGLFFTTFGAFAAWRASTYTIGTAGQMGPGYFPLLLGSLLVLVGIALTIRAIQGAREAATPFEWRAAIAITAAVLLSGALLLSAGLLVAIPVLVVVASFAGRERRWRQVLPTAGFLTALAYAVFILGLALRIPVFWS